jgi:hypothetical protein
MCPSINKVTFRTRINNYSVFIANQFDGFLEVVYLNIMQKNVLKNTNNNGVKKLFIAFIRIKLKCEIHSLIKHQFAQNILTFITSVRFLKFHLDLNSVNFILPFCVKGTRFPLKSKL